MSCTYTYKGKDYTESQIIDLMSKDPEIISKYGSSEQRVQTGETPEDMATFNKKVAKLKESMDVEVFLDPNVPTSRVLGKSDPKTKAAGKPVILINPNAIFKTTAIHEFAHIFVDSFPKGLQNPRIQRSLTSLEGTELSREVRAMYPDLNEEMLQKEILATAIGLEGADIWDSRDKWGSFNNFKNWFFDYLMRLFGVDKSDVRIMTERMLSSEVNGDLLTNLSEEIQEQRNEFVSKERREKDELRQKEKSIDRVFEETLNRVINVHNLLKPTGKEERARESSRVRARIKTRYSSITELRDAMEDYAEADKRKGLIKYMSWVRGEIKFMGNVLEKRKKNDEVTNENLMKSLDWANTFNMIDDLQNLLQSMYRNGTVTQEEKDSFAKIISGIQADRSDIESSLLEMSRETYAKLMADKDNRVESRKRREYEITYDELTNNGEKKHPLTKEEYVRKEIQENKDEIWAEAYEENLALAEQSISDIKATAAKFFSEKNANSRDIQVLSRLVDEKELIISEFANSEASRFDKMNKDHRENVSNSLNQKEKYKGMYSVSKKSGDHYYTSEYLPEFNEERAEKNREANDQDIYMEKYKDVEVNPNTLEYSFEGKRMTINFIGAKDIKIVKPESKGASPMHVTYLSKEELVTIPIEKAIARSELNSWMSKNTRKKTVMGVPQTVPSDKWLNTEYASLSNEKKKQLDFLKGKARQSDSLYKGNKSRVRKYKSSEWIKLNSIMKSDVSRITEGQTKDLLAHKFSSMIKVQKDEFEDQEAKDGTELKDSVKVFADVSNKEKLRVPIPFRAKLSESEQSLDLHTMELMEIVNAMNHSQKTELEATFSVVLDVIKNKKHPMYSGPGKLKKIHAKTGKEVLQDSSEKMSNEYLKAVGILENRIYGIKNLESGKILGAEVNKLSQSVLKYSGTIALLGNYANSIINLTSGTISNLMDAVGGDTFTLSDWSYANKVYWKDAKNMITDWGSNVVASRTNLMVDAFNAMGDKSYFNSKFEENTRAQALFKANSMRPIAKAGEQMMQAKTMYAVLHSIKAMNKKGQYIDRQGKIVKDKSKAAGLDEMISFEKQSNGAVSMILDKNVESTSFTSEGGRDNILLEARNLVKHKISELHGEYDSDIQSQAQRHFWGKLLFFLRKWMIPGVLRRWRGFSSANREVEDLREIDRFYSQDAKDNLEGYYVTAIRFLFTTIPTAVQDMNLAIFKEKASQMTAREKANIRKMVTELSLIVLGWAAYLNMDDDDDDLLFERYLLRRQISELSFFISPPEAIKIASTPTAAIGITKNILGLMVQMSPGNITEEYEQGPNKGKNKAVEKVKKLVPLMNIKDTQDFKDGLKFLDSMAL